MESKIPKTRIPPPRPLKAILERNNIPATAMPAPAQPFVQRAMNKHALRRRSKSVSDLRSLRDKPFLAKKIQVTKPVISKQPIKRPAEKEVAKGPPKPKVIKTAKLPDWDYKGRFNQLQEKHTNLIKQLKESKENHQGFQEENESLKSQLSTFKELDKRFDELKQNFKTIKFQNELFTKEITTLKTELEGYKKLKSDHQELTKNHKELKDNHQGILARNQEMNELVKKQDEELNFLKSELCNADLRRRELHNTIQDMKGNIRVFCRVRPPLIGLEEDRSICDITFLDTNTLEIRKSRESFAGKLSDFRTEFSFDCVFEPEATQKHVFEELSHLVQSSLDGYDVCVFAYGQTGSGKTFTMQGYEPDEPGMIPCTINLIFERIANLKRSGWDYQVHASFLEIYNENIRDLLDLNNSQMEIFFNSGKGTTVKNLTIEPILSARDLKKLMTTSQQNRATATTDFNEYSSRSHAVTKIYLHGVNVENNITYTGSINLVDLAGSEKATSTCLERLVETKNINKSLSTLGNVMLALHNKEKHVPYRNSKLTFLLQSCLGGNSKTLMVVNIAPFEDCYMETISSLRFASMVKEVKTTVKRNKKYTGIVNGPK